jgi:hypothetical protein
MRVILMAVVALSATALAPDTSMVPAVAWAQPKSSSGTGTAAQPQAPVGHRQPQAKDLPTDPHSEQAIKEMDRHLEKALKSICKGC